MITSILEEIICSEFEKNIGRFQTKNAEQYAMDIKIALYIFHDHGEEGYRNLNIRIYAPYNYVAVMVQEDWTIISEDDLDPDKDGLKPGKDYIEGNTGWFLASYHDSCWRSALHDILRAYCNRLAVIKSSYWYEKKSIAGDEPIIEELLGDHHRHGEKHWTDKKIAQSPFPKKEK